MKRYPVQTEALLRHLRTSLASVLPSPVRFSTLNETLAMALFGRPWSPVIAAARAGAPMAESARPGATARFIAATLPWLGAAQSEGWPARATTMLHEAIAASRASGAMVQTGVSAQEMERALAGPAKPTPGWVTRLRPIFEKLAAAGCSTLHVAVREASVCIRAKTGSRLSAVSLPPEDGAALIAALARRMGCDVQSLLRDPYRSGSFHDSSDERLCLARINSAPASTGGLDMVVSVSVTADSDLASLGFLKSQVAVLRTALGKASGLVLFAGIAGSGKSSSCKAAMHMAYATTACHRKTAALLGHDEASGGAAADMSVLATRPDGAIQSQYRKALVSVMRNDPDVVMLGELRTPEEADAALCVVRSGRLVVATLHAPRAHLIPRRLHDLGLAWKDLCSPDILIACACQRLLPVLCPWCSLPHSGVARECSSVAGLVAAGRLDASRLRCQAPGGCASCAGTGYAGRTACAEVWTPSAADIASLANADGGAKRHSSCGGTDGRNARALALLSGGRVCATDMEEALGGSWPTDAW